MIIYSFPEGYNKNLKIDFKGTVISIRHFTSLPDESI